MAKAERVEFAVVGAGLLGLAAARALHQRGHEVVVFEQATVGHRRGGSHGASRIFRYGYSDPMYVRMALLARDLWHDVEVETGRSLLQVTGQCSFGADGAQLKALFDAMQSAGAPAEWLTATEAARQFPEIAVDGSVVYEPDSGVLLADECLAALQNSAACDLRDNTRVDQIVDTEHHVLIDTTAGRVHATHAVVCPGPWSATLLRTIAPARTFTTQEHVGYLRHRAGALPDVPIFIAHDRPAAYGLPVKGSGLYKVALHHAGAVVDPDAVSLDPQPDSVRELEALARRWLPNFEPEPVLVETCFYDNTPDEHFIIDRRGRVVVGAGTSGHGFKFGPLLGELLADLATGATPRAPIDAFALQRPALR